MLRPSASRRGLCGRKKREIVFYRGVARLRKIFFFFDFSFSEKDRLALPRANQEASAIIGMTTLRYAPSSLC